MSAQIEHVRGCICDDCEATREKAVAEHNAKVRAAAESLFARLRVGTLWREQASAWRSVVVVGWTMQRNRYDTIDVPSAIVRTAQLGDTYVVGEPGKPETGSVSRARDGQKAPQRFIRADEFEKRFTLVRAERCPTCRSPAPHLHPAIQHEGEVEICRNAWHNEGGKP